MSSPLIRATAGRGARATAGPASATAEPVIATAEPVTATPAVIPVAGLAHAHATSTGAAVIRRSPGDFGTTSAIGLKSGWGLLAIGSTPWDAILKALGQYAALRDDQFAERTATLGRLPALLAAWEQHHDIARKSAAELNQDETRKVAAIRDVRLLIDREHRDLADSGVTVAEGRETVGADRLKGDYLLEQVNKGHTTLMTGDQGLSVTRVQQALADLGHLATTDVSGTYGLATATAVRAFQRSNPTLIETGIVDRRTMGALDQAFRTHTAERTHAQAPAIAAKGAPGEFAWGTAPVELTAGTRDLSVSDATAAREAVKTSLTAGAGGQPPAFVNSLPKLGAYEARLKRLVLELVQEEYDQMARGKATQRGPDDLFSWDHIRAVAERSKAATDAVFGKWALGPPLAPGVSIHDAWETKVNLLQDLDAQDDSANWRVDKLLTGHPRVHVLDREHGAIQSRGPEKAIVDRVKAQIVLAKRAELLETHKAWPAFAENGVVNIQRFKGPTNRHNRWEMWQLFQTVVHEYLHTLEHSRHRGYQGGLGQQAGAFTLREGVVDYFTHTVLESVNYGDDALRRIVEGDFYQDGVVDPIPPYEGYPERANAEKLAGVVGARNVMAAFFLGDVERIGGTP
jgi:hypothetical protein